MSVLDSVVESLKALNGKPGEFKAMVSVTLEKSDIVTAVETAKDAGFNMLSDIFGIDYLTYPGHQGKRFTVAYNLYSIEANERLFLRVNLADGERLPTITHLWKGAGFLEREVYDMFGIEFEGHPDLRKLITPEDLEGHPLRKDFPLGESPTLFNEGRFLDPAAFRAGMTGGNSGLTGWAGGARKGVRSTQGRAREGDV
ncbi:MAG: NADH-quinone oxidoreductase subunit C [Chloroflexi bacterium AL-N5]|nr:NADH-quinone oxidoreductase subunit C [Chloroflexi bacterium AL-N5]